MLHDHPHPHSITHKTMSLKRKAGEIATDAAKKPKNASITSFFGAPKPNPVVASNKSKPDPTAPATTPIVFDKEAWVAKLSDEQKELLKLEIDTLHESWLGALKDEVTSDSFLNLKRFLKREQESGAKIFPPMEDVYSWYKTHHSHPSYLPNHPN
jgi:uracil-DNA glycosylase